MTTCTYSFAVSPNLMSQLRAYFEVHRRTDRVEIGPSRPVLESKLQAAWALLMIGTLIAACYLEHGWLMLLVMTPIIGSLSLLTARRNAYYKRSIGAPLIVYPDRRVSHRSHAVFVGGEVREVRTFVRKRFGEPDGYGVAIVPADGSPVAMPAPFFDDLELTEAAVLATELGRALGVKVKQSLSLTMDK